MSPLLLVARNGMIDFLLLPGSHHSGGSKVGPPTGGTPYLTAPKILVSSLNFLQRGAAFTVMLLMGALTWTCPRLLSPRL